MFKIEWAYKGCENVHSQESTDETLVDALTIELKNSTIVAWVCVVKPDGETLWY